MKVSIVIVNYKVKNELFECISSIYKSKPKTEFEIIIVDNDEKKTIGKELKKNFPKVKYIKSEGNIGYGSANNLGAKYAKGEYLFVLNPDTKFYSGNISVLLNFFEKDKNTGIIAPVLIDKENKPYELQGTRELTPKRAIYSLSFLSKIFPRNKIYKEYYFLGWNKNKLKEVDVVPGTAFIIRKEIFERIGGFDKNFFLFFEEFDLCRRVQNLGCKIYISPKLKIQHRWGISTAKNKNSQKYFKQSRFYYFRKHFGFSKAILTEIFLRINKQTGILLLILGLASFLRFYKLPETMPFIPDIGWFYVSARDMVVSHNVPLVGIASSHPWLHQGALWTYILGAILYIFNFNPIAPAFLTVFLDLFTLLLVYFVATELFDRRSALIAALFYATFPLIISSAQMPYHTSLIPFFTVLLLISVFKWLKESSVLFFLTAVFILAILYNLELATFSLIVTFSIIFVYGLIKRKNWAIKIFKPKIIILAGLTFTIPMIPMFLYDLGHGFPQTLKFIAWVGYRIAVFFGYPPLNPNLPGETWNTFIGFLLNHIQRLYFLPSKDIAIIIMIVSVCFIIYKTFRQKFKNASLNILSILLIVPSVAYLAAKTNSAAYLPMFFPQAVIILGYFFGRFRKKLIPLSLILVFVISASTFYQFPNRSYGDVQFSKRVGAANEIVQRSDGRPYNIIQKSGDRKFESYAKNYEYLTWWLGNGPSDRQEKLKYYIDENSSKIDVEEKLIK